MNIYNKRWMYCCLIKCFFFLQTHSMSLSYFITQCFKVNPARHINFSKSAVSVSVQSPTKKKCSDTFVPLLIYTYPASLKLFQCLFSEILDHFQFWFFHDRENFTLSVPFVFFCVHKTMKSTSDKVYSVFILCSYLYGDNTMSRVLLQCQNVSKFVPKLFCMCI